MSGPDGGLELRRQLALLQRRHHELLQRLDAGQQRFLALARSVWRVQEDERRRISRELHDGVGQNLTALKHRLAILAGNCGDAVVRAQLDAAIALCDQTLEDTRELSRLLRPQILDDLGLAAALDWLARTLAESTGLPVEVAYQAPERLDPDTTTLVFRAVQEALTNTVRHAGATQAVVRVAARDGKLRVLVWDDGRGCDPQAALARGTAGEGSGLSGIRERVELAGGVFELHGGGDDGGTRIRFTLPLGASA